MKTLFEKLEEFLGEELDDSVKEALKEADEDQVNEITEALDVLEKYRPDLPDEVMKSVATLTGAVGFTEVDDSSDEDTDADAEEDDDDEDEDGDVEDEEDDEDEDDEEEVVKAGARFSKEVAKALNTVAKGQEGILKTMKDLQDVMKQILGDAFVKAQAEVAEEVDDDEDEEESDDEVDGDEITLSASELAAQVKDGVNQALANLNK